VAFPSWTTKNGLDDLPDDFMNTQQGIQSGSTYTFQVKAIDHYNAGGEYMTHIYAVDKAGNETKMELDPVEVKDPAADKLVLTNKATCKVEQGLLTNISLNTTARTLASQFTNKDLRMVDSSGNILSDTAPVGTGTTVNLYLGGKLVDSLTVMILGDLDGNGRITSTDYLRLKASIMGSYTLNNAQSMAGDVDMSGTLNTTDYLRIKAHFLGEYDLHN
jgi:hypothetical protein